MVAMGCSQTRRPARWQLAGTFETPREVETVITEHGRRGLVLASAASASSSVMTSPPIGVPPSRLSGTIESQLRELLFAAKSSK